MVKRLLVSAWLAACWVHVAAAAALAESAVVFPHAGDSRLEGPRAAAHRAIIETLREQGITVRTAAARPPKNASEMQSECGQVTCAPGLLAALRFELAVAVAVWQSEEGPQVNVTIVDAAGNRYPGYALIAGGDAAAAARAALLEARGLHLLGPGPWIHLRGSPAGAEVLIDDQRAGVLPYRGPVAPGDHELQVRAPGFATQRQAIAIPFDATHIARLELDLGPDASTPPGQPSLTTSSAASDHSTEGRPAAHLARDEASPWNFILGGVLTAGGVALATIEPLQTIAREGDCATATCSRRYAVGSDTALQIGFGALSAAAGVALMLFRPLRVEATAGSDHAELSAQLSF